MTSSGSATDLDQVILPAIPPVHLTNGRIAPLQVTDRLRRGSQIVGRFETSGLAGFKVSAQGRPLRVLVSLSADERSVSGWYEGNTEPATLPRLIQIRSQGLLRQCVLLRGKRAHARVAFDLTPEEIPDDGLICVEALDITEGDGVCDEVRRAVSGRVAPDGVAGVRLDKVVFEEPPPVDYDPDTLDGSRCEVYSLISAGGLANVNRQGVRVLRSGMFVVNPVLKDRFGSSGRITLRLGTRAEAVSMIPATWRRLNSELRWLRHATRKMLHAAAPSVERIISIRDGDLGAPAQTVHGNITELHLDSPAGSPLLVILAPCPDSVPTLESGAAHQDQGSDPADG
ncbi:unnamed protein product [[Actinomadura] parvosata subsp. kistnae]|uniref:Uncharacterized protein n=1 Tax=[Actinomadura] parvosata subsp. kistnae TaxID=1909395 RepID=A0A1V0AD28_9ACTN|nr:hypothetical protein [Nonomuraea sp. ATCC 55076]AQZ68107.1 hypothetical protein BKM31_47545 [Nonomuraea sp. ATCC 55076]SPL93509.1 unnamed protein product [Actinomadura parvosata subsp. kistnae]